MPAEPSKPRKALAIVRPRPTDEFAYLDRVFENFQRELREGLLPRLARWESALGEGWYPMLTDLEDKGNAYEVQANLPGLRKEGIDIRLRGRTLLITGREAGQREEKGRNYLRRERSFQAFERTIDLPEDVLADRIAARYENGVLTLNLPKAHPEPERKIPVG